MLEKPEDFDILLKYYEAARNNITTRLAARDNSLLLYLAGIAAIYTAALTAEQNNYLIILLIIPFISCGVALLITQHNLVMDTVYEYIVKDIYSKLIFINVKYIPWEASPTYINGRPRSTYMRLIGETITILFPALLSIPIYYLLKEDKCLGKFQYVILYISIAFLLCTCIVLLWSIIQSRNHLMRLRKDVIKIESDYHLQELARKSE